MEKKHENRKCFHCGASSKDPNVVLHRFPKPGVKNILRSELWAKFVFPNGPWSSTSLHNKLLSEHRMLCSKHFKPESFLSFADQKLNRDAVPTEYHHSVKHVSPIMPFREISNFNTCIDESQKAAGSSKENNQQEQLPKVSIAVPSTSGVRSYGPKKEAAGSSKENNQQEQLPKVSIAVPSTSGVRSYGPKKETYMTILEVAAVPAPEIGQLSLPSSSADSNTKSQYNDSVMKVKTDIYYEKSRKYLKQICQLKNTIKRMKNKDVINVISENAAVEKLQKYISPSFSILLQSQIKNFKRKPKGRRWNYDEKITALRIYKKSPSCYKLLGRLFCLPAVSSLKHLLSQFKMAPGVNKTILKSIEEYVKKQKPSNKEFIIMFDEMSIRKNFMYNKKTDLIEGYQDHGDHGRTSQPAVKALVFMVAGVRKAVKQPISFYLSSANVTADRLAVLIKENLRECFKVGLQISATVCDMGTTNQRALLSLGATRDKPLFKVDDREIVALFDTPHLLKCFRNNFLKYDIQCPTAITSDGVHGTGVAKWAHIREFYEKDNCNPNFVFAPSLKKEHIEPNSKQKMKVNLAAQVHSHTVAAGIYAKVSQGELPADALITADVLSRIDKLFDLLNSSSADLRRGKPYATNMSERSPHKSYFYDMKLFFKNITFLGCPRPPPSINGWIWTLNGIEEIWKILRKKYQDVGSLATRRLQQDPLENLFGCVRGNCGANSNPTTQSFIGGLKTAVISNLAKISCGNCENDNNSTIISNFKSLLCQTTPQCAAEDTTLLLSQFHTDVDYGSIEHQVEPGSGESQACAYVCGFVFRKHKIVHNCSDCKNNFESKNKSLLHNFIENKEYFDNKDSLNYCSVEFVEAVEKCAIIINNSLNELSYKKNLKKIILEKISNNIFNFLQCQLHFKENMDFIKKSVFHICINRFCVLKNRSFSEESSKIALKKKIEILKNK